MSKIYVGKKAVNTVVEDKGEAGTGNKSGLDTKK